jgi:polysaccharide biosynthesis/export protein
MLMTFSQSLKKILFFLVLVVTVSSCIQNRRLVYFPDPDINSRELKIIENISPAYKLQPSDVLSINIKSVDSESSRLFNIQEEGPMIAFNEGIAFLAGHSIDKNGTINLPMIGRFRVAGLTITEVQDLIQGRINDYLNEATIQVKLVSFKVTVLGEVRNPGHYYIYNEQSTVLECLGRAGDLTDYGNRENITLVRQQENGVGATLINLKDPKVLSSEFYFVQPNDVIYVQPMRAKATRGNLTTFNIINVVTGIVSTAVLVLTFMGK